MKKIKHPGAVFGEALVVVALLRSFATMFFGFGDSTNELLETIVFAVVGFVAQNSYMKQESVEG